MVIFNTFKEKIFFKFPTQPIPIMNAASKHKRLKSYLERKYRKLIEEAYNLKYTDDERSDVLTYEALQLDQKIKFLQF